MADTNRTHLLGHDKAPSWLDGLPHDFHGWGPQTPDPEEPHDDAMLVADDHLTWKGDLDYRNHYVWRFDGRRHHHH